MCKTKTNYVCVHGGYVQYVRVVVTGLTAASRVCALSEPLVTQSTDDVTVPHQGGPDCYATSVSNCRSSRYLSTTTTHRSDSMAQRLSVCSVVLHRYEISYPSPPVPSCRHLPPSRVYSRKYHSHSHPIPHIPSPPE